MGCEWITLPLPGGEQATAVVCGGRGRKFCGVYGCRRPRLALCDFPLQGAAKGKTCSMALCDVHRTRPIGTTDVDYCPSHVRALAGAVVAAVAVARCARCGSEPPERDGLCWACWDQGEYLERSPQREPPGVR